MEKLKAKNTTDVFKTRLQLEEAEQQQASSSCSSSSVSGILQVAAAGALMLVVLGVAAAGVFYFLSCLQIIVSVSHPKWSENSTLVF